MPDNVSQTKRSQIMATIGSKDTKPELKVRKAAHAAGFRYVLHSKALPGCPDMAFPKYRLAVYVNGCQWHWHGCKRSRMPGTNREYWELKISRNIDRDSANYCKLNNLGWKKAIIWECEIESGIVNLVTTLTNMRKVAHSSSSLPINSATASSGETEP